MKLTFLGGAGTVTGSKYLVESGAARLLVDCGLFQGLKRLRERNWQKLPVDPASLAAVVLTHAHIDHSGYLPILARDGFGGPVYCTAATAKLLQVLLPDSAHLHEEEARYANKHRYSKHSPALPLYTAEDAAAALRLMRPVDWSERVVLTPEIAVSFSRAGHLLGAASVLVTTPAARVLFSGDVGRPDDLLMHAPEPPPAADWVVIESTYGNRRHERVDPETELAAAINRAVERGGIVLVPAFAVGRAQLLLHLIARLKARRAIRDVPVFLNSPMAADATRIFCDHQSEHRLTEAECDVMCKTAHFVNTVEESKALNQRRGPAVIIAASGMLAGGRVIHHLKAFAGDPRNMLLFTGFQAPGTRGAALLDGADTVKIHGEWYAARAEIVQLSSTSSHADREQLVAWLAGMPRRPSRIFVTHGEPAAADMLRQYLRRDIVSAVTVPEQGETAITDAEDHGR
jgi:metallo-beta-lactamase family protein